MTTRGFGAAHTNLALLSLHAALFDGDSRMAVRLNLGCDLGDLVATLLESRDGELGAGATAASVGLQAASLATWAAVLRAQL